MPTGIHCRPRVGEGAMGIIIDFETERKNRGYQRKIYEQKKKRGTT